MIATPARPTPVECQMLQQKIFVRSSRGRATKVVREHYLRTDIPCGCETCPQCAVLIENTTLPNGLVPEVAEGNLQVDVPTVLLPSPGPKHALFPQGHYIVPDTNILLHCVHLALLKSLTKMDVLETQSFTGIILLQTVLDELRNRSLPLYNRLRTMAKGENKRVYTFHNDFRMETYVVRKPGETINDRNDRAIREAARWYKEHLRATLAGLKIQVPEIVLLSNDRANREEAAALGIKACSMEEYVQDLEDAEVLLDMISTVESFEKPSTKRIETLFTEHYSSARVQAGLQSGTLHSGTITISPYNFLEATVSNPAPGAKPFLLIGRENINRAVHGDIVAIEVLPESEWRGATEVIVEQDDVTRDEGADNEERNGEDEVEDVVEERERRILAEGGKGEKEVTAKVVGIVKRNWRTYVGHVDPSSIPPGPSTSRTPTNLFLLPLQKQIPKIRIRTRRPRALLNQRILVVIDSWPATSRYPEGHFVRALGQVESREAETEALLVEWDVVYRGFSEGVLRCLPEEGHGWRVPDVLPEGRRDFRDRLVCSIDPPGCQDIDDALHARILENGNIEVGVHIADVTNFVKPATPMDEEAKSRGTTVYLVDKRIDMLPMMLGTDLCSLVGNRDRYAMSVIWELTPSAQIVSVDFTKSVIRSRHAFTYAEAQSRIDDPSYTDDLTHGMRVLLTLSKALRSARMAAGALNLASPEVKVLMDSEMGDPVDVQSKALLETNSLVEEFMLLANISVARRIYEAFQDSAMLRRHGAPPPTNFETLRKMLRVRRSLELDVSSSKALATSLDAAQVPNEPFFNTLVRILATRCMLSAEYFPSGTLSQPDFRHYGLATDIYTHFTSPIRRYADVVVHRQLAAAIQYEELHPSLRDRSGMESICKNINYRHRMGQMAGRASVEYFVGQSLKGKRSVEEAYVMRVLKNGFVVFVPRFGLEGLVNVKDLGRGEVKTEFLPDDFALKIGKEGVQIATFDRVNVSVEAVREESTGKQKVKMLLIEPKIN